MGSKWVRNEMASPLISNGSQVEVLTLSVCFSVICNLLIKRSRRQGVWIFIRNILLSKVGQERTH